MPRCRRSPRSRPWRRAPRRDDPLYYKGKRLTVLVNFAAGGPTDIEGRLFAKHIAKHIDGQPATIVQNMDGAGGLVGNSYLGEIAPKDGTMVGYFTGAAWLYATEPNKHRVDFRTYEFVAYQPGTTVYYVRTDVAPGMKEATDIVKAQGLVTGGLSADSSKDLLIRLTLDMLGVPFKYVTGYRSNQNARLALQQNEINFFAESPPGYRSVVEPSLVKNGQVIPLYYDPGWNGESISVPKQIEGLVDPAVPGALPEDQGQRAVREIVGRLSLEPRHQRRHAAPGGAAARIAAGGGRGAAGRGAAAQRRPGVRAGGHDGARLCAQLRGRAANQPAGAHRARGLAGDPQLRPRLHQERQEMIGAAAMPAYRLRNLLVVLVALCGPASPAAADNPYYKGKRLTVLINFTAGGPTDIEGRLFAKHLADHIESRPSVIVQNMDGAGGMIGAGYLGEVAPKDGTIVGYFTGTAWRYANDPERFRTDFKTYDFLAYQPGSTVYYARADVAPGLKDATDIAKARELVAGGLGAENAKDLLIRLALDMLGVPYRYVTPFPGSQAARLALLRNEISFFSESPPSYRAVIAGLVRDGTVIPIFFDPEWNGESLRSPSRWKACRCCRSRSSIARSRAACRPASCGTPISPS